MDALSRKQIVIACDPDSLYENISSCDGLVFIAEEDKKVLLNPITREINELPASPFALDPLRSYNMYGLGYDVVSDDYKVITLSHFVPPDVVGDGDEVVALSQFPDYSEMFISLYSVRNGTWKRVESSPYDHTGADYSVSGAFVNGCIHWLASRTTNLSSVITAFDLAEEKFSEVPPPSSVENEKFLSDKVAVLGGCLCMVHSRYNHQETDVWMMKEYGVKESWTKFAIVNPEGAELKPLCLLGQEQVVLVKDGETFKEKLVIYNLKEEMFTSSIGILDGFYFAVTFVESLVSPYCRN